MSCKRWLWVVLGVFAMHAQAEYQELDAIIACVKNQPAAASGTRECRAP